MSRTQVLAPPTLPAGRPIPASLAGARVLIAEDNEVNLEVAKFHLEDLGCATASAANGAIALELARQSAFDYVLMDCQMPVMDGFEALRAIRVLDESLKRRHTPVIAVTAADDIDSQQECDRAGFDGFLAKPFSADQLKSALLHFGSTGASPALRRISPSQSPPSSPTIDVSTFVGFVNDFGIESAVTLLKPFVTLLGETAARLDAARAKQDVKALQALSHKVAGASGTVGAARLSRQARAIEGLCKRGSPVPETEIDTLNELVHCAAADFGRLREPAAIAEFIKTVSS